MTSIALHQPPSTGTVLRAYIRALYTALRRERLLLLICSVIVTIGAGMVAANLDGVATATGTITTTTDTSKAVTTITIGKSVPAKSGTGTDTRTAEGVPWDTTVLSIRLVGFPLLIGLVLAFRIWRGEPPSRRFYHLSMPVPRGMHALIKTFAGWVWLLPAVVVALIFSTVAIAIVLKGVGHSFFEGFSFSPLTHQTFLWLLALIVLPITIATIAFVVTSPFVIATDSPFYWLGGTIIAFGAVLLLFRQMRWTTAFEKTAGLWSGRWGLLQALSGDRLIQDASGWAIATLLWFVVGVMAMGVAAYVRRT